MKLVFVKEFQRFHEHLNYPENDRIILSAPFGIGKTTFLKDYFSNHPEYEVFHLFPANYSVSENDNIFEYIKYDILYQIINKTELNKEVLSHTLTFWSFMSEKGDKMVKPFLEGISLLNKPLAAMIKMVQGYTDLGNEYLTYHEKIQQVDLNKINEFRENEENKIGSIFERNFITQLIQYYITEKLKTKEAGAKKKSILIIDDLDRIDPEHFFRILNIFAAHIDRDFSDMSLKNKFGFDQILFVFDKDNARNIFHYRYGPEIDYDGYLSKFYSYSIFIFDPFQEIEDAIKDIMEKIIFDPDYKLIQYMSPSDIATGLITHLLKSFLRNKKINLRNILKLVEKEYKPKVKRINLNNIRNIHTNSNFLIIICFDFLIELLGEPQGLQQALETTSKSRDVYSTHFDKFYFLGHLICLTDNKQHSFSGRGQLLPIEIEETKFYYRYNNSSRFHLALICDVEGKDVEADEIIDSLNKININRLIYEAFLVCKEINYY